MQIQSAKKVAILTHSNPDLDTIGSALALHYALLSTQKTSYLVGEAIPHKYSFLTKDKSFKSSVPKDTDLIVAVDSAAIDRVAPFDGIRSIVIDHHKSNCGYGDLNIIDPNSPSTGEIVATMLFEVGAKISTNCANALLASIISDTKQFSTPRTSKNTFLTTSKLIGLGGDAKWVSSNILQNRSLAQMRIEGIALSKMDLIRNGSIACVILNRSDMTNSGATLADTSEISQMLLGLHCAQISIVLVELDETRLKCSLRAKESIEIDLSVVAESFGGGGHEKSAGFIHNAPSQTVLADMLKMLQSRL